MGVEVEVVVVIFFKILSESGGVWGGSVSVVFDKRASLKSSLKSKNTREK